MSRMEYVSLAGLRIDGRRPGELRKIACSMGVFEKADGSAYFEQGNTKVLATVYGPREVTQRSKAMHDRAIINCEYILSTLSVNERRRKAKTDRRSQEISMIIRQTLETVVMTTAYPRSQIDVHLTVIQADGGTRCAAINAATLALIDAGIPLKEYVASCSVGYLDNHILLDLNYLEDSAGGPDIPVALLPQSNKITMLQLDAKLPLDKLELALETASAGCRAIHELMDAVVKQRTRQLVESRGLLAA
eukprot:TRINITY_DN9278_c0_g1_i1.p1 TRINITY_DN9278_c0_g1~~TRINITY_DN9278_c0_g1_i1.p1  ORF type:complete len:248 (-),score=51.08 TRINITY_DN9278_c0_g1_i1:77-820(-)